MRVLTRALCLLALGAFAHPALADEIQLKDGKTFYGTIVGFDNKMFKVKTDFGFIYIEKDKIATIVPNKTEGTQPAATNGAAPANGPTAIAPNSNTKTQSEQQPIKTNTMQPTAEPAVETVAVPAAPRVSGAPVRPQLPATAAKTSRP